MRERPQLTVGPALGAALVPVGMMVAAWLVLWLVGGTLSEAGWPTRRSEASASGAVLLAAIAVLIAVPRLLRLPIAGLALGASIGIGLIDLVALRHYQDVLSVGDWMPWSNLPLVGPSLESHLAAGDLALLVPFALAALALRWHAVHPDTITTRRRLVIAGAVLVAAVLTGWSAARLVSSDPERVFEFAFQRRELVSVLGLPAYHVYDLTEHLTRRLKRARVQRGLDVNAVAARMPAPPIERPFRGAAAGANVVMVSLESFQQFVLGLRVEGQLVAPTLTALAAESLQFTRFFDQTHRGTTSDAEWMALQSLFPLEAGAVATRLGELDLHALPEVLEHEGYATRSAVGEPSTHWNMGRFHRRLGFEQSWFAESFQPAPWIGIGLADDAVLPAMASRLSGHVEPFMAFLLTSSSHHPYDLPIAEQRLRLGALQDTELGRYLQTVHYTDRALGRFVEELRTSGRLERTLLVLYGDHTAALNMAPAEEVVVDDASPELAGADPVFKRWWSRSRVPLLIRIPGGHVRGVREHVGGHTDIAPTVIGLLGVGTGARPWLGRDLLAEDASPRFFTRSGVVADAMQVEVEAGRCFSWAGRPTLCQPLEALRERARETLRLSDHVIHGDLIEPLAVAVARRDAAVVAKVRPVLVIAHRGNSIRLPESTEVALTSAFEVGADLVEIDVRVTRDRHAVVFHDDTLDRVAGRPGRVEDLTLAEFRRLDTGRWFAPGFAGMRPLTLDEALQLARGRGGVLLDLKSEHLGQAVAESVARVSFDPCQILVGAWTATQRQTFRRWLPGARLLRTEGPPPLVTRGLWAATRLEGVWGWELDAGTPSEFVEAVARSGLAPIAYTVNDEATMRALIDRGVAGIETDNPALLRRVVDARGLGTVTGAAGGGDVSRRW